MNKARAESGYLNFRLGRRFLFLGRNSGIHGLGHLFRENAHFFARLFWFLVLLASAGCLALLLVPVVQRGAAVGYTVDTRYLPWSTAFPAVTVCELYNAKLAQKRLLAAYPDFLKQQPFEFQRYITDLAFNRAVSCRKGLCEPCGTKVPCDFNWRELIERVHKPCNELIEDCKINGKEFPCCTKFHQVDSEYGPCYSFNTLQVENLEEPLFFVNRSTGVGDMSFRLLYEAQISVHSPEELSTNFLDSKLKFDLRPLLRMENHLDYMFSLVEFFNDPMLVYDAVEQRGCRYLREVPAGEFDTYKAYSYGACRTAHNTEHVFEHCGCVHPVRDTSYKDKYCNFTGLNCLVEYETQRLKLGLDSKLMDEDPCLPSCQESELTTVHISRRWALDEPGPGIKVAIQMASLPSLRFQRNKLKDDLDLVVSVGGMAGLFFGASIFSLLEVLYLFLRKPNCQ